MNARLMNPANRAVYDGCVRFAEASKSWTMTDMVTSARFYADTKDAPPSNKAVQIAGKFLQHGLRTGKFKRRRVGTAILWTKS